MLICKYIRYESKSKLQPKHETKREGSWVIRDAVPHTLAPPQKPQLLYNVTKGDEVAKRTYEGLTEMTQGS